MIKRYCIVFYCASIYSMHYPAHGWHRVIQIISGIITPNTQHIPITIHSNDASKAITIRSLNGPAIPIRILKKNSDGTYSIPVHIHTTRRSVFTLNIAQLETLYTGNPLRLCHGRAILTIHLIPAPDSSYYDLRVITIDCF